jgi:hypothetical protein
MGHNGGGVPALLGLDGTWSEESDAIGSRDAHRTGPS